MPTSAKWWTNEILLWFYLVQHIKNYNSTMCWLFCTIFKNFRESAKSTAQLYHSYQESLVRLRDITQVTSLDISNFVVPKIPRRKWRRLNVLSQTSVWWLVSWTKDHQKWQEFDWFKSGKDLHPKEKSLDPGQK